MILLLLERDGLILAILVGIIIIGGIKRIAWLLKKESIYAPFTTACLYIIGSNFSFMMMPLN